MTEELPSKSYHTFMLEMRLFLVKLERAQRTVTIALGLDPSDQNVIRIDSMLNHWIRYMRMALK